MKNFLFTPLLALSAFAFSAGAGATNPVTLQTEVYNADSNSFHVNATLVYGEHDALLVDTGFTKADALRIAAKVLDSGKTLNTIFISQADPDFYFGAEVLKQLFPNADIVTTPAVKKVIEEKLPGKVAFWGPKMGNNAPVNPVVPKAITGTSLTLEGQTIEIRGTKGLLAHRPYLWIPSTKTVLGNVAIFGGLHLWTADTQSQEAQQAWKNQLTEILALQPALVIPGHMQAGTALTIDNVNYSLNYLNQFQDAVKSSNNSAEVIKTMTAKYPDAQLPMALDIGAKVHKGEMKW